MEGEINSEETNESFTDTEKWAQEVLERARNRSEKILDTESPSLEDAPKPIMKGLHEAENNQIESKEEDSFRGSIVTLEDIEGEQIIEPLPPESTLKNSKNDDFGSDNYWQIMTFLFFKMI